MTLETMGSTPGLFDLKHLITHVDLNHDFYHSKSCNNLFSSDNKFIFRTCFTFIEFT